MHSCLPPSPTPKSTVVYFRQRVMTGCDDHPHNIRSCITLQTFCSVVSKGASFLNNRARHVQMHVCTRCFSVSYRQQWSLRLISIYHKLKHAGKCIIAVCVSLHCSDRSVCSPGDSWNFQQKCATKSSQPQSVWWSRRLLDRVGVCEPLCPGQSSFLLFLQSKPTCKNTWKMYVVISSALQARLK